MQYDTPASGSSKFGSRTILLIIGIVLIVGALAAAGYFYWQYQDLKGKQDNPNQAAQQETDALIKKMTVLIQLPESDVKNGEPTLATVLDKEKLKDQEFFKNAENDDKLLIYAKAKQAYLYRPSTNKIINVGPVSIGEGVTVRVLNGTTNANLATSTSEKVKAAYTSATISTGNAAKTTYTKTVVVDLAGTNAEAARAIAESIGAEVVSAMPEGEAKPEGAQIVIVVGTDQN